MKRVMVLMVLAMGSFMSASLPASAQSFDVEQLILDYQKLIELKTILQDLKNGYDILHNGYETIRGIAQSNFLLHQGFLNGLLEVKPVVAGDPRVGDIVSDESALVSAYNTAFSRFRADPHFTSAEIGYLSTVYGQLLNAGNQDIANLNRIITADTFRMSDAERIHAIDAIYQSAQNRLLFIRSFNNSTTMLAVDRATEAGDVGTAQRLYGIK